MRNEIKVKFDPQAFPSIQAAIEHIARQLLRHDREPCAGRVMSNWDCQYLAEIMGDLCVVRESIAEAMASNVMPSKK